MCDAFQARYAGSVCVSNISVALDKYQVRAVIIIARSASFMEQQPVSEQSILKVLARNSFHRKRNSRRVCVIDGNRAGSGLYSCLTLRSENGRKFAGRVFESFRAILNGNLYGLRRTKRLKGPMR